MSPQRPLSAIVESTARFLEETAPDRTPGFVYPLDPTPENIAELGAACRLCGRVHDLTGRVTGDRVWCPCGEWLTVHFPARVVKEGQ